MTSDIQSPPDAVVVGAGFAGAVVARQLAEAGRRVHLIEKRPQIGGNMYDSLDEAGVLVHWFGPHLFHTNMAHVFDYLKRFSAWKPYEHRVQGRIGGKLVPIPFNYTSMERLFSKEEAAHYQEKLPQLFPDRQRVSVLELANFGDEEIAGLGQFVYENVFVGYTAKQWGVPAAEVDNSVINRVPVVLGYDDRYFEDKFQAMPEHGYTPVFQNILDHPGITVRLNTDAGDVLTLKENRTILYEGKPFDGPVVYTGAPDALLDHQYGILPYRSLDLQFSSHPVTEYQPAPVVNYPNEEAFTRITEFKKLTGQQLEGATTILHEYPIAYDRDDPTHEPYYPIESPKNRGLYKACLRKLSKWENFHLCGRLAEYKYYNMDAVIDRALDLSAEILQNWQ